MTSCESPRLVYLRVVHRPHHLGGLNETLEAYVLGGFGRLWASVVRLMAAGVVSRLEPIVQMLGWGGM